jgi:hypothetical protein
MKKTNQLKYLANRAMNHNNGVPFRATIVLTLGTMAAAAFISAASRPQAQATGPTIGQCIEMIGKGQLSPCLNGTGNPVYRLP